MWIVCLYFLNGDFFFLEEDIHSLKKFMVVLRLLCGFDLSFRFLADLYLVSVQQKNKKTKLVMLEIT